MRNSTGSGEWLGTPWTQDGMNISNMTTWIDYTDSHSWFKPVKLYTVVTVWFFQLNSAWGYGTNDSRFPVVHLESPSPQLAERADNSQEKVASLVTTHKAAVILRIKLLIVPHILRCQCKIRPAPTMVATTAVRTQQTEAVWKLSAKHTELQSGAPYFLVTKCSSSTSCESLLFAYGWVSVVSAGRECSTKCHLHESETL